MPMSAPERINFPLAMRPSAAPLRAPAAWFIPGGDPGAWLAEVAGWGVPMGGLRLYVLPTSVRDRRPIGVLVTAPEGQTPRDVRRAQPYGRLAGRLYLPIDGRLEPPVSDAELSAGLRWEVNVLHPAAGLSGFSAGEALRVSQLLAPPRRRPFAWDRAVAGPAVAPRLVSVEPEQAPTVEAVLGQGREDIHSEPAGGLPKTPDESAWKDMASRASRPGLKAIQWLSAMAGGAGAAGAAGDGWMGQLSAWASRKLADLNRDLADARRRELERLQHLLESDPDRGLRFAIPLRDAGARGVAAPGDRLPPRDPRFDLGKLGAGGKAADAWQIDLELRQRLVAQYRAAANRELTLGRHRRAAYIFAELLGDYSAAAAALERGRHYREAAALYQEYLRSPLRAAECLERGGLLPEAIALYERQGRLEKAGDLYALLERPADAARCYRLVVDQHLAAGARLAAAKLLEGKLSAPEEALEVLTAAWPDSDSAGSCLRESFQLLSRLGRHEEAGRRVGALGRSPLPAARVLPLVEVLGQVAGGYPNPAARALAADAAKAVAGRRLRCADESEKAALVKVVGGLAPEDRLLPRDATRYLSRRAHRPTAPPPSARKTAPEREPSTSRRREPVVVRQFRLAGRFAGSTAVSAGREFYAAGLLKSAAPAAPGHGTRPEVVLLRGRWDGQVQSLTFAADADAGGSIPMVLSYDSTGARLLLDSGPRSLAGASFAATDAFPAAVPVETLAWASAEEAVGFCHDEQGALYAVRHASQGELVLLVRRAGSHSLLASFELGWVGPLDEPPAVVAREGHVYVGAGGFLFRVANGAVKRQAPPPKPVRRLAASAPYTRSRVAVSMEEGGLVLWKDADDQPFGEGLLDPHVAFTRGGLLVAVTAAEGRIYGTDGAKVRLVSTFRPPAANLLAVIPAARLNEFAVFTTDGAVNLYQVPG